MTLLHELRRQLGQEVATKHRVYLDQRFWNSFADIELGESPDPVHLRLYDKLKGAVQSGTHVCPIEHTVLFELLRQTSDRKRRATATVIDTLSLGGISILARDERMFIEVLRYTQALFSDGPPPTGAPRNEVWTRPAFMLGHSYYAEDDTLRQQPLSPPPAEMAEAWKQSFSAFLDGLPGTFIGRPKYDQALADGYNRGRSIVRAQFPNARALYLEQVRKLLHQFRYRLADVFSYYMWRNGEDPSSLPPDEREGHATTLVEALIRRFDAHDLSASLPTVHLWATFMTHIHWTLKSPVTINDFYDFEHAMAALPYFDLLLTDTRANRLIRSLDLQALYATATYSDPMDALAALS